MASLDTNNNEMSINQVEILIHCNLIEEKPDQDTAESNIDNSQMAQWFHEAVLGANNGLVSVTSLMMCVGALTDDFTIMLLAGLAGLVVGACTMAFGVFISVYTLDNKEISQAKREKEVNNNKEKQVEEDEKLPNPFHAALASAFAFSVGAVVSLIAVVFIRDYKIRIIVVGALASMALLVFGGVGVVIGKSKISRNPATRNRDQSADWWLDDYGYYSWL